MKNKNPVLPVEPRPALRQIDPYYPGMSIAQIKRQYGFSDIIKLASNENSLGPSPKASSVYKKLSSDLFRYPDDPSTDLRSALANKFKLDLGEVIVGAGSDEIIELLGKAFLNPTDEIVVSESSFLQYRAAGQLMGAKVISVPLKDMKHNLVAMARAVTERTKLVFVANPNNPTGTYNTKDEVDDFLSLLPEAVIPVFDEAYYEYAAVNDDYPSVAGEFFKRRPLVVLRTFSKAFGLAGLRVGYALSHESVIQTLNKIRPPFNVSSVAQGTAEAALYDQKHIEKSVKMVVEEKKKVAEELETLGYDVVPSAGNFLLFHVPNILGRGLFDRLLRKGVIARKVDEYGLPDYLRVTIGTPNENKKFLKALKEVGEQK